MGINEEATEGLKAQASLPWRGEQLARDQS